MDGGRDASQGANKRPRPEVLITTQVPHRPEEQPEPPQDVDMRLRLEEGGLKGWKDVNADSQVLFIPRLIPWY